MRDGSVNQLSARTPEAKSLSGDILAVTAYGSGFCPAPAYAKDGKPVRTKILEGGGKKSFKLVFAVSGFRRCQFGTGWRMETLRSCSLY
jgi:hypothetical protein